uniref:cell division protein ZipA n=3 Tax=Pseudomonas TaxID=286 RepID=UPI00066B3098
GKSKGRKEKEREKAPAVAAEPAPVDEVLIINVIARDESGFKGPALLQNILESGLRFGDMDIFHRHESMAGNGEILFSMANAVKPGTFDLDDIDNFSTRAVSFFLGLPGPRHPKQAFDVMVAAARKLAHELNGELKDEQRSVLTAQTIEHYRQRIIDHERRSLMQKR